MQGLQQPYMPALLPCIDLIVENRVCQGLEMPYDRSNFLIIENIENFYRMMSRFYFMFVKYKGRGIYKYKGDHKNAGFFRTSALW